MMWSDVIRVKKVRKYGSDRYIIMLMNSLARCAGTPWSWVYRRQPTNCWKSAYPLLIFPASSRKRNRSSPVPIGPRSAGMRFKPR
jgi:hypothetical protein